MDTKITYLRNWRDAILSAASALKEDNFELYDQIMNNVNTIVDNIKKESSLTYECTNFGMANYIFEDALPKLFINNKQAIREFISAIKCDTNLISQFQFYKALDEYDNSVDGKEYINEALNLFYTKANPKTIAESNSKLFKIIKKYGIRPSEMISDDNMKFYESCDYLFKHNKKLNNILESAKKINFLNEHISKNKNIVEDKRDSIIDLINNFDKKYTALLNNEERELLKNISASDETKKEEIFNNLKLECLSYVDKMMEASNDKDRLDLTSIKEQINDKNYNKYNIIDDVIKLLEIKDILQ